MNFEQVFKAATGHAPFRWQGRLYGQLLKGELPSRCNIPTGLGKTSIISIWLLALAEQLRLGPGKSSLPRRLVYIVDRRAVVDQATEEVEDLLREFTEASSAAPSHPLASLARCLAKAGSLKDSAPFTVSTLRGQHADNRLWLRDPSCPAVIIGTVDMIGSRLLFSGYGGLGRYSRSLHAGLLAQDTLVVLDEAHLCPSFVQTLQALTRQLNRTPSLKPQHLMLLSATQLSPDNSPPALAAANGNDFGLDPSQDLKDKEVAQRLKAAKALSFLRPPEGAEPEKPDAFAARMAAAALKLSRPRSSVVVFANTVDMVNRVCASLKSPPLSVPAEHVLALTGEMRGKERDELVEHPVFARFCQRHRDRAELSHPIFLVATAAAEVGINFDADHAVCDLVTLERMIQRLGRVNRFGDGAANVQVILPAAFGERQEADSPEAATLRLLQSLPGTRGRFDASPAALSQIISRHPDAPSAFAPRPPCPPLDEARLDDWSFTSLWASDFPRPQVSYWLRGLTPDDSPHTWLAWRADLDSASDAEDARRMAETLPLRPAELAQVVTYRAGELIAKLRERAPDAFAAVLDPAGKWSGIRLGDLPEKKEARDRFLLSATVVLPAGIGGLKAGVLSDSAQPVPDVVDTALFQRILLRQTGQGWAGRRLSCDGIGELLGSYESLAQARRLLPRVLGSKVKLLSISGPEEEAPDDLPGGSPATQAGPDRRVAYFASPDAAADLALAEDFPSLQRADVPLGEHHTSATEIARQLTRRLALPAELADAVVQACARHDLGKKQSQWQKAIGNLGSGPLAKSAKASFDGSATAGYRHEFGSLLEAARDSALAAHPRRDLILHLVAAHHGHARPGFSPEAYGILPLQSECAAAARDAELRFARLQRQLGWWQLAYLESLVKCADALASSQGTLTPP
jgi:CRISPR-associated endonuclease/helicase Cas3